MIVGFESLRTTLHSTVTSWLPPILIYIHILQTELERRTFHLFYSSMWHKRREDKNPHLSLTFPRSTAASECIWKSLLFRTTGMGTTRVEDTKGKFSSRDLPLVLD